MPLFIVGFILLVGLLIYAVYYYFIQAPSDSDPRMKKPSSKFVGTARRDADAEPERKVIYFPLTPARSRRIRKDKMRKNPHPRSPKYISRTIRMNKYRTDLRQLHRTHYIWQAQVATPESEVTSSSRDILVPT